MQVEETTEFEPQVRGEIGAFGWHYVTSLPASEEAAMQYNTAEGARHHFYQVCFWHAVSLAVLSTLATLIRLSVINSSDGAGGALCQSAEALCEEEEGTRKKEKA